MPFSEDFDYEKWKEEKIKAGDWLPKDEYSKMKDKRKNQKRKRAEEADSYLPSRGRATQDDENKKLRLKDLDDEDLEDEMEVVLRDHSEVLMMRKEIKVIIEEPSDPELEIRRELVFDTETTGLSNKDKIVEFSLIELIDGIKTGRRMHKFLNPKIKISKRASEIHGITNEKLIDAPMFKDVVEDMISFIGHGTIIAHNAKFDQRMLNNELESVGWKPYEDERFIDTLAIARFLYPDKRNNQDALCARFNVDNHNRVSTGIHSAYEDTIQLYHVYGKLCSELKKIDRCSHDFKIIRKGKDNKRK
jgi:DNA polymerase III epsilon subunit